MPIELIVRSDFEGHSKGDRITDSEEVSRIMESAHSKHVIRINSESGTGTAQTAEE